MVKQINKPMPPESHDGTCQVCERMYSLKNGRLPSHSHDDDAFCLGSFAPPLEESCSKLEEVVGMLVGEQSHTFDALEDIKATPPEVIDIDLTTNTHLPTYSASYSRVEEQPDDAPEQKLLAAQINADYALAYAVLIRQSELTVNYLQERIDAYRERIHYWHLEMNVEEN